MRASEVPTMSVEALIPYAKNSRPPCGGKRRARQKGKQ